MQTTQNTQPAKTPPCLPFGKKDAKDVPFMFRFGEPNTAPDDHRYGCATELWSPVGNNMDTD